MKVSAVIPAFNEVENISLVVSGLRALDDEAGMPLVHEIIVADNNSSDATALAALNAGARVIFVRKKGYGNACFEACKIATGDVFLFVDGDHTADLSQVKPLVNAIEQGVALAIGARANAQKGSLTAAQIFGNAFACFLIRLIWRAPVTDLGPLRAIRRSAYELIGMRDKAFGWTIEMQIRAAQLKLPMTEIAVSWFPRYAGKSKVSGTISGVFGAGWGILSMIVKLKWRELSSPSSGSADRNDSVRSDSIVRHVKTSSKEN